MPKTVKKQQAKTKPVAKSKSSAKRARRKAKSAQREQGMSERLAEAKAAYQAREQALHTRLRADPKQKMLFQALERGTLRDKVRALSVLVQEHPQSSLDFLRQLATLAKSHNNKTQLMVNREIKDLLVGPLKDLLERSRPFAELVDEAEFKDKPAELYLTCSVRHQLRRLLNAVGAGLRENLSFFKTEYVDLLAELARGAGSKALECYELLVDKVGDSDRRVGPKAAKYVTLGIMFQSQSSLGLVQRIQFRIAGAPPATQLAYLACLANVDFGKVEDKHALYKALEVFLETSQRALETLGRDGRQEALERASRGVRQATRGVNRLLAHLKNFRRVDAFFAKYMDAFFKMGHVLPERARVQVLVFVFQVARQDMYSRLAERFMALLYSALSDEKLLVSALSEQFLDLLFSALSADHHTTRILGFVKRLFRVGLHCPSRVVLAILVFYARLVKEKPVVANLLMYKLEQATPAPGAATVLKAQPAKWAGVARTREKGDEGGGEMRIEAEKEDAEDDEGDEVEVVRTGRIQEEGGEDEAHEEGPEEEAEEEVRGEGYDPQKRNPKFCGAEQTGLWELLCLAEHYNYLVRKFARMILEGKAGDIDYKGNPMADFARGAVINRLVLRNVKQVASNARTPADSTSAPATSWAAGPRRRGSAWTTSASAPSRTRASCESTSSRRSRGSTRSSADELARRGRGPETVTSRGEHHERGRPVRGQPVRGGNAQVQRQSRIGNGGGAGRARRGARR